MQIVHVSGDTSYLGVNVKNNCRAQHKGARSCYSSYTACLGAMQSLEFERIFVYGVSTKAVTH